MGRVRILAIEDDPAVCRLLQHSLAREDYDLQIAGSGEEGLAQSDAAVPALVLLDLGLPGIDGLEVCRQLRLEPITRAVPIIILSGKGDESDVVRGLEMGADDYIVKPFSPRILNARLNAVLRRRDADDSKIPARDTLQLANVRVEPADEVVLLDGAPLTLSPVEYRFVYMLVRYLAVAQGEESRAELGVEGLTLYAESRLERLLPLFDALLSAFSQPDPVLAAFAAMAMQSRSAERCRDLLNDACQAFTDQGYPIGELATSAVLVHHHLLFDSDSDAALAALQRVDALYLDLFPSLSAVLRIVVAQALALGSALLFGDFQHAQQHLEVAEALVEERSLANLAVINQLLRNHEWSMQGRVGELGQAVESSLGLRTNIQVSAAHRALLCLCQLCDVGLRGEFDYLRQVEASLQVEFSALFPPQSLLRQRLVGTQVEAALWRGEVVTALQRLESVPRGKGLLWPLLAGMEQLCRALKGEAPKIPESLCWQDGSIDLGSFAAGHGALFIVRALQAAGNRAEARSLLARLLPEFGARRWSLLVLQATALKLSDELVGGDRLSDASMQELESLLQELRQRRLIHLSVLLPDDLSRLLAEANRAQVEPEFVTAYARERLRAEFLQPGRLLPMLQLTTLGGVRLDYDSEEEQPPGKFSRSQRECLALLVATPDGQIDQEAVQLLFWPDSSPEKGRSSLDTMLSRLRKTLQDRIAPLQVRDYLKLQKGTLSLEHVDVDVYRLLTGLRRGQEHYGKGEFWHADVALAGALWLWRGPYAPGACRTDQAAEFAERVHIACLDATLLYAEMLIDGGQTGRAEAALVHALGNDRCNAALTRALYRCYMRDRNLKRATDLLQGYSDALRRDGHSAAELAHAIAVIKVGPGMA